MRARAQYLGSGMLRGVIRKIGVLESGVSLLEIWVIVAKTVGEIISKRLNLFEDFRGTPETVLHSSEIIWFN